MLARSRRVGSAPGPRHCAFQPRVSLAGRYRPARHDRTTPAHVFQGTLASLWVYSHRGRLLHGQDSMHAQVLRRAGEPLQAVDLPTPEPQPDQLLIRVSACGVCRTDLHVVDGELAQPKLPLVLGHEIVGYVVAPGARSGDFAVGDRVAFPGSAGPVANASSAAAARKTCAQRRALPVTRSTAAMPNMRLPMLATVFAFPSAIPTPKQRRCSARD